MKKQHRYHRSKIFIYRTITASLPFIEVNLNLTSQQMLMLINGLKYVIPCQNQFSNQSTDQLVTKQYDKISTIIKNCLRDHRISTVDERAKQAFQTLKDILYKFQLKQLPRKLQLHAQHEYKTVQTIQSLLRRQRSDIIPFSERKGLPFEKCMYVCLSKPIRNELFYFRAFWGFDQTLL